MELAPLRLCSDCKNHTGVECTKTLDVSWNQSSEEWVKTDINTPVYCLEFKPAVAGPALVRCADCSAIRYHAGPPESLSCDHSLVVNVQSVTTAGRCCALFATRHQEATP